MRDDLRQCFRLYQYAQHRYQLYADELIRYRMLIAQAAPTYQKNKALSKLEARRNDFLTASAEWYNCNRAILDSMVGQQQSYRQQYTHMKVMFDGMLLKEQKQIA